MALKVVADRRNGIDVSPELQELSHGCLPVFIVPWSTRAV